MKSRTLKIISLSDGERSEFVSDAIVSVTDGVYRIDYEIEGDPAFLLWDEKSLRMERSGAVCLAADFILDEHTEMQVRSSQGCGRIPIITLKFSQSGNTAEIFIFLIYDLIFGKDLKRFHLEISA